VRNLENPPMSTSRRCTSRLWNGWPTLISLCWRSCTCF